jgi:hypothetical protein
LAAIRRTALVFWLPWVLAGPIFAQTRPMPTIPEAVETATEGVAPWDYGVGVGLGWDSNIEFREADGTSGWGLSPRADLARNFRGPKGELRVGAVGSWTGYWGARDLDRYNAGLSLDGTRQLSSRTTGRASAAYGFDYGDSSSVLSDQGVLLPRVPTETLSALLGVTHQVGTRTSLRVDGRIYRTTFGEQEAADLGLVDGRSLRGTAALERTLGPRDSAALEYSVESALGRTTPSVDSTEGSALTHYGSLQWTRLLSPRSGLLLEAGASYTADAESAGLGQSTSFYGGATFNRKVKRSNVSLFVRREVAPAFGLGVSRVESRFGLDVAVPVGRYWRVVLNGTATRPDAPEGSELVYGSSQDFGGSVARRLGRRFEASAEVRYRRRGAAGSLEEIRAVRAGVFLSLVGPDS